MKDFGLFIFECLRFLTIKITLWGYSFTLLDIFLFECLAGIAGFILFGWLRNRGS